MMKAEAIQSIINKPVTIKCWHGTYLQNGAGQVARFQNTNRNLWEWLIILPGLFGNYIIKSYKDGTNLRLGLDGKCSFGSKHEYDYEQWSIDFDGGHFYFINNRHHGNVMQAD